MSNTQDEFPQYLHIAEQSSAVWQHRYLWLQRLQLGILVLAGVAANFGRIGLVVTLVCFMLALTLRVVQIQIQPDRMWWNARAVCESLKTLCWRYCVGDSPFEVTGRGTDELFVQRAIETVESIGAPIGLTATSISPTESMRLLRRSVLEDRINTYKTDRIVNQLSWYDAKSKSNGSKSLYWSVSAVATELIGAVLALVALLNNLEFDWIGAGGAVGAALLAWTTVKQFEVLERSYAYTNNELLKIQGEIEARTFLEAHWADYVANTEEAISREHTAWRASRGL